jgi:hypothetical protein
MKALVVVRLLAVVCICVSFVKPVSACRCGGSARGNNAWENAKQETQNSAVVFEGTPVRFEFRWNLLSAKDGDLIPAVMPSDRDPIESAHMFITFRVRQTYKGEVSPEVQLNTGIGGGDCAAVYATGLEYLVYASASNPDQLWVSMCSPGGWIGGERVATDLRYLRKERPTTADLARISHWTEAGSEAQREEYMRAAEEEHKRYAAATGRICGTLIRPESNETGGSVAFLSTQGYLPAGYPETSIGNDGSFCSPDLGPGKYYLYFVRGSEQGAVALYYPGVNDVAKAKAIEVTAGHTASDIVFTVAAHSAYSVRGFVSADAWPDFRSNVDIRDINVILIRSDGDRRVWYGATATFILPKLAYFKIENVVPGVYAACVMAPGPGWMTRKTNVSVTSHMKFISLQLVRKK